MGSTDSELADTKSYLAIALDDQCEVHEDDRFRATSLLGQASLASFRNQSTITFLKDSVNHHAKAVTLCPEYSPQRGAVLITYYESLLENVDIFEFYDLELPGLYNSTVLLRTLNPLFVAFQCSKKVNTFLLTMLLVLLPNII